VNLTNAILLKNRAGKAIYKGCAIAALASGPRFYATNFQSGRVEVFNSNMSRVEPDNEDAFRLPGLSNDYAPFNIQNVGGNLVVTFAPGNRAAMMKITARGSVLRAALIPLDTCS
jgi:hypothetical protein